MQWIVQLNLSLCTFTKWHTLQNFFSLDMTVMAAGVEKVAFDIRTRLESSNGHSMIQ